MRYFPPLIIFALAATPGVHAQSQILESVKQNPQEALSLCKHFQDLNSQGISTSSKKAIAEISRKKNLSEIDAEILSIYVIGLYCPQVK